MLTQSYFVLSVEAEYNRIRREYEGSEIVVVSVKEQLRDLQAQFSKLTSNYKEQV
jgi:hypothetical protein